MVSLHGCRVSNASDAAEREHMLTQRSADCARSCLNLSADNRTLCVISLPLSQQSLVPG